MASLRHRNRFERQKENAKYLVACKLSWESDLSLYKPDKCSSAINRKLAACEMVEIKELKSLIALFDTSTLFELLFLDW